jgi:hypothetical protein
MKLSRLLAIVVFLLLAFVGIMAFGFWRAVQGNSTLAAAAGVEAPDEEAPAADLDGPKEDWEYRGQVWVAFSSERFEELERQAEGLRHGDGERFRDGRWKLNSFYQAVTDFEPETEEYYGVRFQTLESWKQRFPESKVEPIMRAKLYAEYAWFARGSGTSDTVTEEGWHFFEDRLRKSLALLEKEKARLDGSPEWYVTRQRVALGLSEPRADYEALCAEAFGKFPDYYQLYHSVQRYLLPRWYGQPGEWQKFAENAAAKNGPHFYTRIALSAREAPMDEFLVEEKIDWALMKAGWDRILADYPDSPWMLNNYARFAVAANDRAKAKELFQKIGTRRHPEVWKRNAQPSFQEARDWALAAP